ncbi:MAG: c-type cytochrome [Acidobacteriota bacterium]|nr:c-type cytochrome [Acidobacteriota bacterium]
MSRRSHRAVGTRSHTGCAGVPAGLPKETREAAGLAPSLFVALLFLAAGATVAGEPDQTGLGHEATSEELSAAGYTVFPDGKGLPEGRGTAREGKAVYQQFCAACHGRNAQGEDAAALVGGRGSLTSERPRKIEMPNRDGFVPDDRPDTD